MSTLSELYRTIIKQGHAKTIHVVTEKDLENNLKDIEEALAEYEHIIMLQTLFDGIEIIIRSV